MWEHYLEQAIRCTMDKFDVSRYNLLDLKLPIRERNVWYEKSHQYRRRSSNVNHRRSAQLSITTIIQDSVDSRAVAGWYKLFFDRFSATGSYCEEAMSIGRCNQAIWHLSTRDTSSPWCMLKGHRLHDGWPPEYVEYIIMMMYWPPLLTNLNNLIYGTATGAWNMDYRSII